MLNRRLASSRVSLVFRVLVHEAGSRSARNKHNLFMVRWRGYRGLVCRPSILRLRDAHKMNLTGDVDLSSLCNGDRRIRREFG